MVEYAGQRGPNLRILMLILAMTAASSADADVGVKVGACRAEVRGDSIDEPDTTGLVAVERWGDTIKTTNLALALAVSA